METNSKSSARLAVEYVRMSTDRQVYSISNQQDEIKKYAQENNIQIIRSYIDGGKSGLKLNGRNELKKLLSDALNPQEKFQLILVYDVSRWGRFQDTDESAHYEFICRQAGRQVIYIAEQFVNDNSPISSIVKNIKRVMAGEYSRELSNKILQSQLRRARSGNFLGGYVNYGLQREIYDQENTKKYKAEYGQWKSIKSDKTLLALGPESEVAEVKEIYRKFNELKWSYHEIASDLEKRNIAPPKPFQKWNRTIVKGILTNSRYVGTLSYNKFSTRLGTPKTPNPVGNHVYAKNALKPIIEQHTFDKTQERIRKNIRIHEVDYLIEWLRKILTEHGKITANLIREIPKAPRVKTYIKYFGTLKAAYTIVGFGREKTATPRKKAQLASEEIVEKRKSELISTLKFYGAHVKKFRRNGLLISDCYVIRIATTSTTYKNEKCRIHRLDKEDALLIIDIDENGKDNNILYSTSQFRGKTISKQVIDKSLSLTSGGIDLESVAFEIMIQSRRKRMQKDDLMNVI